ncbi:MAG TPA: DUF1036 domain-containing protein [Hellea balneolensis]|uniref:DUF1036 domain-containing protein n=1 Tax=Hellea balneolensis TaxID=287478 RepID=A0A7V5U1L0_9PROT|nr:DUF1036 domain-containing protein [Hellea balneolensis]
MKHLARLIFTSLFAMSFPHIVMAQTDTAQDKNSHQMEGTEQNRTDTSQSPPPWQVCNETSYVLEIAIAGVPKGKAGTPVTSWGWTDLRPGACKTIMVEKGTPRFVYAKSARFHQGPIHEWRGQYEYCVGEKDFTARPGVACNLQNLHKAKFLQIVPTETRTALVEPDGFGRRAEMAGLQRLLKDNNFNIRKIDGHKGRQTSRALRKFLKDHKLKSNLSMEEKYTALEKGARETIKTVGLRLCNKTRARLWSAIAHNNADGYEARGWWPIDPGKCIHPFAQNLKGKDVFYTARMETPGKSDKTLRVPAKSGKSFCVGPSIFASLKHEYCRDQGYIPARFKAVPKNVSGVRIDLTEQQFSTGRIDGLRQ